MSRYMLRRQGRRCPPSRPSTGRCAPDRQWSTPSDGAAHSLAHWQGAPPQESPARYVQSRASFLLGHVAWGVACCTPHWPLGGRHLFPKSREEPCRSLPLLKPADSGERPVRRPILDRTGAVIPIIHLSNQCPY